MKKTVLLLVCIVVLLVSFIVLSKETENKTDPQKEYLKKVLFNLEEIKSATYVSTISSYSPWDTVPEFTTQRYYKEYRNPLDTIDGVSYAWLKDERFYELGFCYDGNMRPLINDDVKELVIDSFKFNRFSFRVVSTPFFTKSKTLIDYFLNSKDSLITESVDNEESVQYSFTIYDDVLEIISNQIVHDTMHLSAKGKISKYDIWFSKQTNLPYKIIREMPHNKTMELVSNVDIDNIKLGDFVASDYFPKGYEIKRYR